MGSEESEEEIVGGEVRQIMGGTYYVGPVGRVGRFSKHEFPVKCEFQIMNILKV